MNAPTYTSEQFTRALIRAKTHNQSTFYTVQDCLQSAFSRPVENELVSTSYDTSQAIERLMREDAIRWGGK